MKQIRFNILLKPIALLLLVTFLIQGCKIYDKRPVATEKAVYEGKVKIINTNGRTLLFDDIYYKDDSLLYGIIRNKTRRNTVTKIPKKQIKDQLYKAGPNGTTETFITVEGKKYNFDSYYFENDTLFGLSSKSKNANNEIVIPKESIHKIYLFNKKKSGTGTTFLIIGMVGIGLVIVFITGMVIAIREDTKENRSPH